MYISHLIPPTDSPKCVPNPWIRRIIPPGIVAAVSYCDRVSFTFYTGLLLYLDYLSDFERYLAQCASDLLFCYTCSVFFVLNIIYVYLKNETD